MGPGEYRGRAADGTVECWFCGGGNAGRPSACLVKLTRNERYVYFVVGSYESEERAEILVPRCHRCMRRHRRRDVEGNAVFAVELVSVVGAVLAGLVALFNMYGGGVRIVAAVVVLFFVLSFLGAVSYSRRADKRITERMTKRPTYDYPPLKQLMDQGWNPKPSTPSW